jgi:hypothetical protein
LNEITEASGNLAAEQPRVGKEHDLDILQQQFGGPQQQQQQQQFAVFKIFL